jgi:hypothetical protein
MTDSELADICDEAAAACRLAGFPTCTADIVAAVYAGEPAAVSVDLLTQISEELWERGVW